MRFKAFFQFMPAAVLLFRAVLCAAGFQEQVGGVEEADDPNLAMARASQTWSVVEKVGAERWEASWTLRSDGKTFDAHWKHHPGGTEGDLRGFARIASLQGTKIVVERPGLGRYTGTLSPDRTRITGRMSWAAGTWEVRLEKGALPAPGGGPAQPAASLAGAKWQVLETVGSESWRAEWTVRADGRSFDATWTHTPGNDRGRLNNFARIASISGNQITVNRPGLGNYTGTISANRLTIRGRMSWAGGAWQVTLPAPLPSTLR